MDPLAHHRGLLLTRVELLRLLTSLPNVDTAPPSPHVDTCGVGPTDIDSETLTQILCDQLRCGFEAKRGEKMHALQTHSRTQDTAGVMAEMRPALQEVLNRLAAELYVHELRVRLGAFENMQCEGSAGVAHRAAASRDVMRQWNVRGRTLGVSVQKDDAKVAVERRCAKASGFRVALIISLHGEMWDTAWAFLVAFLTIALTSRSPCVIQLFATGFELCEC